MLTSEKIHHIAELAKLKITDEEAEHYAPELSKVFGYIDELKNVDIEGVEPTAQVTGLANSLRDDKIKVWNEEERLAALKQADRDESGKIVVKKIL